MSLARFTLTPRFPTLWREFDDLFRDTNPPGNTLLPAADVIENPKNIELRLDLPGVLPEQIDVKLEGNTLTISADRAEEKVAEQSGWIRRERTRGSFSRAFSLPATLEGTTPEATFRHGVLTVVLPKREEAQPRSVKVKVEA